VPANTARMSLASLLVDVAWLGAIPCSSHHRMNQGFAFSESTVCRMATVARSFASIAATNPWSASKSGWSGRFGMAKAV
jgi:hypothetical protein